MTHKPCQNGRALRREEDTKRAIAENICSELTVHAQVEEELFYPWLRDNLDDDDLEMVEEAQVEHASAKDVRATTLTADRGERRP